MRVLEGQRRLNADPGHGAIKGASVQTIFIEQVPGGRLMQGTGNGARAGIGSVSDSSQRRGAIGALLSKSRRWRIGAGSGVLVGGDIISHGSHEGGQRLSLDELHGKVVDALFATDRVYGGDVGVMQVGCGQ